MALFNSVTPSFCSLSIYFYVFSSFSSLSLLLPEGAFFFSSLSSLFSRFLLPVQHGVVIQLFSRRARTSFCLGLPLFVCRRQTEEGKQLKSEVSLLRRKP